MIKKNSNEQGFSLVTLLVLVLLGLVSTFFSYIICIAWAMLIIICVNGILTKRRYLLWYAFAMSPGLEVFGRMLTAPLVPVEMGKYFIFIVIILLLIDKSNMHKLYNAGEIILLLLISSLLFAIIVLPFDFGNWVMHGVGIIQLGVLLSFTAKERWSKEVFFEVLKLSVLPVIPILVYITVKTPKFQDIEFALGANAQTTGGFGSNQVSTILGSSLLIIIILLILKRPLFKIAIINYSLLGYIFFRGLLTFSRGGMFASIFSMFIFIIVLLWGNTKSLFKYVFYAILFSLLFFGIAFFADNLTGNQLKLRYEGETGSTLNNDKEKTLNTITSSRYSIAETDILIFLDHPIIGVGPGESKNYREQYGVANIIPHTEYTRLLSEHGIGGLCVIFILTFFPFFWIKRIKIREGKAISAALFTVAILNSFHAAMRTNATVVYYILGAMPVYYYVLNHRDSESSVQIEIQPK